MAVQEHSIFRSCYLDDLLGPERKNRPWLHEKQEVSDDSELATLVTALLDMDLSFGQVNLDQRTNAVHDEYANGEPSDTNVLVQLRLTIPAFIWAFNALKRDILMHDKAIVIVNNRIAREKFIAFGRTGPEPSSTKVGNIEPLFGVGTGQAVTGDSELMLKLRVSKFTGPVESISYDEVPYGHTHLDNVDERTSVRSAHMRTVSLASAGTGTGTGTGTGMGTGTGSGTGTGTGTGIGTGTGASTGSPMSISSGVSHRCGAESVDDRPAIQNVHIFTRAQLRTAAKKENLHVFRAVDKSGEWRPFIWKDTDVTETQKGSSSDRHYISVYTESSTSIACSYSGE